MTSYHDEAIWKPLRLYDEASIAYLNELFADGWFIMEIGVDGLQFLAFNFPLESSKEPDPMHRFMAYGPASAASDMITLVILTKGNEKGRQMALGAFRDETGYIDGQKVKGDRTIWEIMVMLPLEQGMVVIYEKKERERKG